MGRPLFGADTSGPSHDSSCHCGFCIPNTPDLPRHPTVMSRPVTPSSTGPTHDLDVYAQTRDSLRLASTALDAAYIRLRELRIAIRGLSASSSSDNMNPGHSAIVLSGEETAAENRPSRSPQAYAMEAQPAGDPHAPLPQGSFPGSVGATPSSSASAPPVFLRPNPAHAASQDSPFTAPSDEGNNGAGQGRLRQLRTRRSLLEDHLRLRREDNLTSIGRRAAARAASEAASAAAPGAETQSLYDRSIQIASELEQTIDRYLANRRSLSNALANAQRTVMNGGVSSRVEESIRTERNPPESGSQPSAGDRPASSRARAMGPISRRVSSGTPRFNLGLRAFDVFQRHLPDPPENVPTSGSVPSPRLARWFRDEVESSRDGNDAASWVFPGDGPFDRIRQQISQDRGAASAGTDENVEQDRTATSRRPFGQSRRRGWARLDPDGNEISTDEEEEMERSRMANTLVPTTRNPISHATDGEGRSARVRLHSHRPFRADISPWDGSINRTVPTLTPLGCTSEGHAAETLGSSKPYHIDPLPMPVEHMACDPVSTTTNRAKEGRMVGHKSFPSSGIGR